MSPKFPGHRKEKGCLRSLLQVIQRNLVGNRKSILIILYTILYIYVLWNMKIELPYVKDRKAVIWEETIVLMFKYIVTGTSRYNLIMQQITGKSRKEKLETRRSLLKRGHEINSARPVANNRFFIF